MSLEQKLWVQKCDLKSCSSFAFGGQLQQTLFKCLWMLCNFARLLESLNILGLIYRLCLGQLSRLIYVRVCLDAYLMIALSQCYAGESWRGLKDDAIEN